RDRVHDRVLAERRRDVAVDLAGAEIDEALVADVVQRLEQADGPLHVRLDALIAARPRLADDRERRRVEDDLRLHCARDRIHGATIDNVPLVHGDLVLDVEQPAGKQRGHFARQHVRVGAVGDQTLHEMRADEAGAAGYEDARVVERIHGPLPSTTSEVSSSASLYVSIDFQNPRCSYAYNSPASPSAGSTSRSRSSPAQ